MASIQGTPDKITGIAGEDLSTGPYRIVGIDFTDGRYYFPDSNGNIAHGITDDAPDAAGEPVTVAIRGPFKVIAGGTMQAGETFMSNTAGAAIAWTAGENAVGYVLDNCVSGDVVRCVIDRHLATVS